MMTPGMRRFSLTAHVATSVRWLGAVAGFFVLSITGLTSDNPQLVRSAYIAMNLLGQLMIVPLSLAALATGIIQGMGTKWGLARHYWVLVKLSLTVGATALLLLHQFTAVSEASRLASDAAEKTLPDVGRLSVQLVGDAGLAVLVLVGTTALSIYKPWGRIGSSAVEGGWLSPGRVLFVLVGVAVFVFAAMHVAKGGMGMHRQ